MRVVKHVPPSTLTYTLTISEEERKLIVKALGSVNFGVNFGYAIYSALIDIGKAEYEDNAIIEWET